MAYGLEIIVGEYWSGKSFFTHRRITGWMNKKAIKIGNYVSPDFHLQYRSVADLINILKEIHNFKKDPKNLDQEIIIIVDEASLYFGNREFKTFPKQMLSFLVQLRKLNVRAIVIIQDLKMVDINFRRLCYNVRKYYTMLRFIRMYKDYELLSEDANLNDPVNSIMSAPHLKFGPWLTVNFVKMFTRILPILHIFFWSSYYDTNELILPDYDVLDMEKCKKLFPYTKKLETSQDYREFIKEKEKVFLERIWKEIKNKRVLKYYKDIYYYSPLS